MHHRGGKGGHHSGPAHGHHAGPAHGHVAPGHHHPHTVPVPVPVPVHVPHHAAHGHVAPSHHHPHTVPVPVPVPVPVHVPHHAPPAGTGPRVLFASFGGSDLTAKVQHMYKTHGGTLRIAPGQYCSTLGGDPFPGQHKDFVVVTVDSTNQSRVHIAADTQAMHITSGPQASAPRTPPHPAKEILLASYGGVDVTAKCRELFGPNGLHFTRQLHEEFGDPLPGTVKALVVMYLTTKENTPHRACAFWEDGEKPILPRDHHHHQHQQPVPHHPPHHAPAPLGPRVLFASFGGSDLTAKVQHMYKTHGGTLSIAPGQYCSTLGGDPFPGQHKDFVVVTVDSTNQSRVHVAADGDAFRVAPGPQTSTRRHPPAPAREILLANYGGADVTAKCRALFGVRGLHFERGGLAAVFGDTLPGTTKALVVLYLTTKDATPRRACAYWEENEKPSLPREVHHGRHA